MFQDQEKNSFMKENVGIDKKNRYKCWQEARNTDVYHGKLKSWSYEPSYSPSWLEDAIMAVTGAPRPSPLNSFYIILFNVIATKNVKLVS